jgi:Ion channel
MPASYLWEHCFSDRETAYCYSLMSYTTVGYGDVALARPWRLMGGLEAMAAS